MKLKDVEIGQRVKIVHDEFNYALCDVLAHEHYDTVEENDCPVIIQVYSFVGLSLMTENSACLTTKVPDVGETTSNQKDFLPSHTEVGLGNTTGMHVWRFLEDEVLKTRYDYVYYYPESVGTKLYYPWIKTATWRTRLRISLSSLYVREYNLTTQEIEAEGILAIAFASHVFPANYGEFTPTEFSDTPAGAVSTLRSQGFDGGSFGDKWLDPPDWPEALNYLYSYDGNLEVEPEVGDSVWAMPNIRGGVATSGNKTVWAKPKGLCGVATSGNKTVWAIPKEYAGWAAKNTDE